MGPMGGIGTRLNHVSIQADDIEASGRFYEHVFGMERLPTPNFGFPVYWLRLGSLQLHLFQTGAPVGGNHHIGLEVDDFEASTGASTSSGSSRTTASSRRCTRCRTAPSRCTSGTPAET